jgi:hypothetical protein
MKKTLIILIALLSLGLLGGGLYTTIANLDTVEPDVNGFAAMNPFPYDMPDVVMDPPTGFSLL